MVSRARTVAFIGMKPTEIIVESQISPGMASFCIVGLPDKTVGEAKERIRSAFFQLGLGFPQKRVTVNMAPADIPKAGSHYDLPIALSILGAMDAIDASLLENIVAVGELGLDGNLPYISGTICAAMLANERGMSIICPKACEKEAVWSGNDSVVAPPNIMSLVNHLRGTSQLTSPVVQCMNHDKLEYGIDLADVHGQLVAKRAIEVAAAGGHNVLMVGPPGSGKSMLATRARTILPTLSPEEALETTCIYSLAGMLPEDGLIYTPPYREPHHSASLISIVGGGSDAKPGELSLAHNGILFLDELPEFQRNTIEALRQPLETNNITISRAKEHITYPANIQLIAAMNPCKCGSYGDSKKQCSKAPRCAIEYRNKISGPILDRFDITVYVSSVKVSELFCNEKRVDSKTVRARVAEARVKQHIRSKSCGHTGYYLNGKANGRYLDDITKLDTKTASFFQKAVMYSDISTRSCHKILRVSRTIADLDGSTQIKQSHVAEALQYRLLTLNR
ncbi:MAG: YifB family Mg chelatase-like AAA ATPase [Holosporales bacterium]|jgi:magnesium chelatase family protein|nr:YifB family Mg chelatase-like AAA ATPase [Holosporales bacterium]